MLGGCSPALPCTARMVAGSCGHAGLGGVLDMLPLEIWLGGVVGRSMDWRSMLARAAEARSGVLPAALLLLAINPYLVARAGEA